MAEPRTYTLRVNVSLSDEAMIGGELRMDVQRQVKLLSLADIAHVLLQISDLIERAEYRGPDARRS